MVQMVRCHACQACFPLDPEILHSYRDGLIQGKRVPRYWAYCPACGRRNVIELAAAREVIPGKRPA